MKLDGSFNYDASSYHIEYKTVDHHDGIVHHDMIKGYDDNNIPYYGIYDSSIPIYDPDTGDLITGYYDSYGNFVHYEDGDYIYPL